MLGKRRTVSVRTASSARSATSLTLRAACGVAAAIAVVAGGGAVAGAASLSADGSHAAAAGRTVDGSSGTALHVGAAGTVTSVDGVATAGQCGTPGAAGTFVLVNSRTTKSLTAHVTTRTRFAEPKTPGANFADVCVDRSVTVEGTVAKGAFTADAVTIALPRVTAAGKVTSVDGVATAGQCGTAGAAGTFVLVNSKTTKSLTAHVTATTSFSEPKTPGANFADVCVDRSVTVAGTVTAGIFTADAVTIHLPPVSAAGKVTSVDGVATAGQCGTAGAAGTFVLVNSKTTKSLTAHVTAATRFAEPKTTSASFADVCVDRSVTVAGTVTKGVFTADAVTIHLPPVSAAGKVTSVDGVATAGQCGTAGAAGTFVLVNSRTTKSLTAHVTATTSFSEPGTTGASFADVCVDSSVTVEGTVTKGVFSADAVTINLRPVTAAGTVTSVDGVATAGQCGTAGAAGTFVLVNPKTTKSITAHVTATTKFAEPKTTGASFADVCVDRSVTAEGTVADGIFTADAVTINLAPVTAAGTVTSVDGVATAGQCGTAGAAGTFVLVNPTTTKSITAHVTATTSFTEPKTTGASFADVCVDRSVTVEGTVTAGIFTADAVTIDLPPVTAAGTVTSLDGVATTGQCGTAGAAGTFVLVNPTTTKSITAHVTATTSFTDPTTTGASFADVCVGESVTVGGTVTAGIFTADTVTI